MFYYDIHALLDGFIRNNERVKYMLYGDFYKFKEIGSGGYGTVYTAKYRNYSEVENMESTRVVPSPFSAESEKDGFGHTQKTKDKNSIVRLWNNTKRILLIGKPSIFSALVARRKKPAIFTSSQISKIRIYSYMEETVVLKRFKSFDEAPELFISEVSNNW